MSTTALEIDAPQLCATRLVAHPGTLPTVTIPLTKACVPDVDGIWRYLHEPSEFFGYRMPNRNLLAAALSEFSATAWNRANPALLAASITIVEGDVAPQILVTGSEAQPLRPDAVRVALEDAVPPAHRSTDPWWRRMAARTTSRGELDQRERWLNGRGYADAVSEGVPMLGALVFETGGSIVGVENSEPTSVIDQLQQCGVITAIGRSPSRPTDAERVWWLSPRYETHPVAEIDGTSFATDVKAVPSFARWS